MSKTYIVKTEIDTVTVEANSAREAVKMVAEGRKISGRSGKLTIRAGRSTISNVLVFHVRKSSDKFYRERWQVTEAPVEVVAEVATVEVATPAEVVAEQIEANTEAGMVTIDIISGVTVEVTAEQFAIEALTRNADAKFLARKYSDRIAKAAGVAMTDEVKLCIVKAVNAVVAKYDEALYA